MNIVPSPPRVALFTDAFHEANGVARIAQDFEAYAIRRGLPLLCVCAGPSTRVVTEGPCTRLELRRGPAAFRLEHDLAFDLLLWRHARVVERQLKAFKPDILHITGPSDIGQLGAYLAHRLRIPMAGSWHTNLHEYAALRAEKWLGWLPTAARGAVQRGIQRCVLDAAVLFYRMPRVLLAPNQDLVDLLARRTHTPTSLMRHGVDAHAFAPSKRQRPSPSPLHVGFVGRLSAEKQVRLLATVERALLARGETAFQFIVIGDGAERDWLAKHMTHVTFLGVQHGEALAQEVANLDLFVFPSESETFGLAVLEAMASGVPVVAMARGGPSSFVEHEVSGLLAPNAEAFVDATLTLFRDAPLRTRLGAGARIRALAWSWDAVFDQLYEIYSDTANGTAIAARVRPYGSRRLPAHLGHPVDGASIEQVQHSRSTTTAR